MPARSVLGYRFKIVKLSTYKRLTVHLKQERTARLELEIKQNHLRHWLQEIKPVWDQLKNKIEHPELPEVTSLEQHFTNLDKICSIPSVK